MGRNFLAGRESWDKANTDVRLRLENIQESKTAKLSMVTFQDHSNYFSCMVVTTKKENATENAHSKHDPKC
jgi:hypothetical protein